MMKGTLLDTMNLEVIVFLIINIRKRNIKNNAIVILEWKIRPHLTLACFNDVDETKCITILKEFAQKHKTIPAYIDSVGMFKDTKTIFVSPTMNKSMFG